MVHRLFELAFRAGRCLLLRLLRLDAGLLGLHPDGGQLLLRGSDLGSELQRRGVTTRSKGGLEVHRGAGRLRTRALVEGLGFFSPRHGLAVRIVQDAVRLPFGVLHETSSLSLGRVAHLGCIAVCVLTSRRRTLVGERVMVSGVCLSAPAQFVCFLVGQRQH